MTGRLITATFEVPPHLADGSTQPADVVLRQLVGSNLSGYPMTVVSAGWVEPAAEETEPILAEYSASVTIPVNPAIDLAAFGLDATDQFEAMSGFGQEVVVELAAAGINVTGHTAHADGSQAFRMALRATSSTDAQTQAMAAVQAAMLAALARLSSELLTDLADADFS